MNSRKRSVTIYVRNKQRYNPASKLYNFINVRVENFAGTKIGDIKEEARRQSGNNAKIDDLYLNNERLADDRSVAHYNLEDGTILETTSNPFWAVCLFIKHCEAEEEKRKNPDNPDIQNWTNNEFKSQPPHFPTLDDFVAYINNLKKKGAAMNPYYTQRHLGEMFTDYQELDVGRSSDPLGAFINRYAVKLGFRNLDDNENEEHQPREMGRKQKGKKVDRAEDRAKQSKNTGAANRGKVTCDDCESTLAELYCGDCQNAQGGQGLNLCMPCSQLIHAGAARRRHNVQDVTSAPKVSKPYVPHAFKAPFSILLGLYSGLTERRPVLSMTEDQIKLRAQPLTDTDLQDKQTGQYCGGFDCMEKILMAKGLVQREDSRNPTYALTETGEELAGQLYEFQQSVQRFLKLNNVPHIPQSINTVCGTRKVCLIIDEQERDKDRFHQIATERGVDVQFRQLGAGDYLWILTPPMASPTLRYTQQQPTQEKVLPFLVERKSWEDFKDSVRTKRFQKQVNHMLHSGIDQCFYLMEGSINSGRYKPSAEQQKNLKDLLEKIFLDNGFYVNYTASWYKSAIWLLWATALASEAQRKGQLSGQGMTYAEFMKRTSGQSRCPTLTRTDFRQTDWKTWEAEQFIDGIFRDSINEISLIDSFKKDLGAAERHVLNIHDLEAYNKFMLGVYIVRTEKAEDRQRIQGEVDWRSGGQAENRRRQGQDPSNPRTRGLENIEKTKGYILGGAPEHTTRNPSTSEPGSDPVKSDLVFAPDSQTENFMIQQALALSSREVAEQENRALLSPEKSPPTTPQSTSSRSPPSGSKRGVRGRHMSGKKSSTATKSKEEEELELAIKLSLEDPSKSKEPEDVPVFNREVDNSVDVSASDSIGTENTLIPLEPNLNMDSQEEFQYVLELSKKTATVKEDNPNKNTDCDHFKQLKMKKPPLSSLDKEASEISKSKDRETNVKNISESKQNLGNGDDEDLKRALELSLQEDQHLIKRKSSAEQSNESVNNPSIKKSLRSPVSRHIDESDKELELALQLSLQPNDNSAIPSEKVVGVPTRAEEVIEIKDSQDLLDDHLESKRSTNEINLQKDGKNLGNKPPDCIVLNDSQEEDMGQAVIQSNPGKLKETEFETADCLVPDSQSEVNVVQKTGIKDGACMVVPETVLEADIISTSLQSYDSTLEPEPFQISPANRNDKVSVANTGINTEAVESVNVGNEDSDIIPPSPTSSQKSASKTPKLTQSFLKKKSLKDDIKDQLDKENTNLGPYSNACSDDYEDEYCDNLVLPPLSPSSPDTVLSDKTPSVSTKSTTLCSSQPREDLVYKPVKIKQEKIASSITNEEIVMDSQTLEDSQEELPQYSWMQNSPRKTDQITVKVVTPSKMGDNSTSNIVKGISLSQGSTSSININIKIEHIDKSSESSEGIHKKKLIDDEEYARRLQRKLDEEYELSKNSALSKIETRSIKQEVVSPKKPLETTCEYTEKFDDLDAVIAQSLHEEINSPGPKGNKHLLLHDEEIAKQLNKELNNPSSSGKLTAIRNQKELGDEVCVEDFVEENREERSRQIQMDEDLARQLLESEDNYTSKGWLVLLRYDMSLSIPNLQQIRREQSEKFLRDKCGTSLKSNTSAFGRSPQMSELWPCRHQSFDLRKIGDGRARLLN
uniref:Crossover junction endonuclease MUS81 n=1 Tax=Magallana gigas TaxID=29159 RepID=K1P5Q1_MAGGI